MIKFNDTNSVDYSKGQLQSKYSSLKKQYATFKELRNQSGFGWNERDQTVQQILQYGTHTLLHTQKRDHFTTTV